MTRLCWCLVGLLSRLLEADERDVVRGDFTELGKPGWQALREVGGLVARRQAIAWLDWRPWLALFGCAVPSGFVLACAALFAAMNATQNAVVWVFYAKWSYFANPGWRETFWDIALQTLRGQIILACLGWTIGFALVSISRKTAWAGIAIVCVVFARGMYAIATSGRFTGSGLTVLALLLHLPPLAAAWVGMKRGRERSGPDALALAVSIALAVLMLDAAKFLERAVIAEAWPTFELLGMGPDRRLGTADDVRAWPLHFLPLVAMLPSIYVVTVAARLRWRPGISAA